MRLRIFGPALRRYRIAHFYRRDGWKAREIAEELKIKTTAVKSVIYKLRRLRLGSATEEGIAIRIAIAGNSGAVGGIVERAIKTGSMEKATENPTDIGRTSCSMPPGKGSPRRRGTGKKATGGAVSALEKQAANARTANRQQKLAGRVAAAEKKAEQKAEEAGSIIHTTVSDAFTKAREAVKDKCEGPSSGCSQPGTTKQH